MGFEQYHEPANEPSQEVRTFARMLQSLTEEAEASSHYTDLFVRFWLLQKQSNGAGCVERSAKSVW